ncbi:dihydrofolate reductase family protein [Actinoplanes couchii]|uniref:dihydrofolate reductase family protein n=1 Tax=Actinoplanes couchii TaxID=403638 RepID=UPI002857E77F|nr:dihydrofolate reductase family protein [Actinoplanes couchii]MDR6318917.1 5-amino-6-(5-phosphoribosylamino)uracil reductase [Actinoplanes couchii]
MNGTLDGAMTAYMRIGDEFGAEATLMGRGTIAADFTGKQFPADGLVPTPSPVTHVAPQQSGFRTVVFDAKGKTWYDDAKLAGNEVISVLGTRVSEEYLQHLRERGVSYLFAGEDGRDLAAALGILGDTFGMSTVLLQGGGVINGAFLAAGLIDEISVLLHPGIDGLAGAPAIFEATGSPDFLPADGQQLELKTSTTLEDGLVWIHYAVHHDTPENADSPS